LTSQGTIAAGDIAVPVVAAAVGPGANVAAGAINTVLDQNVDQRLRGFPENPERRVDNPEATAGGVDTTGSEFIQADVDAAMAELRVELDAELADALGPSAGAVFVDAAGAPEPVIQGADGLVGIRDQATAEITGSLAYDRLSAERTDVIERAEARLAADETVLPAGHDLLPGATRVVAVGEARAEEDRLIVAVTVSGASAPRIDQDALLDRVRGRTEDEAQAAMADLGTATVDLWPGWVDSVPELDWRIDLRIGEISDDPSPSGSPVP
jgi:hypothetical protein